LKYIDIAPNFDGQFEFNMVRPFTYTHEADLSYTNYNQGLAHPLGANFYESIIQLHYQPKPRWALNLKLIIAKVGDDTTLVVNNVAVGTSNYGGDILRQDAATKEYGNKIGQGAAGTIAYINFRVSYQAWHNIYVDLETFYRNKNSTRKEFSESTFYFGVGVRMNVGQRKYDF